MSVNSKWLTLLIICLGVLISSMNGSIINLANPTLAREFGIGIDQVQWIVTIYLLVVSSLMLFFGRIGDRIGSYKIYNSGFLIFTLGSLFCGLVGSFNLLLLGRIVQAIGAAMLMATGMGIVATSFPQEQRGRALGITVVAVGLGNMSGPSLGGLILHYSTWHYIFFVNIPFGIIAFILGLCYLRSSVPADPKAMPPLDRLGALLLGLLVSALILFLSQSFAGSSWFILVFLGLLPLFWWYEKKHPAPLWNFELLRNQRFSVGNLLAFLSYFAYMTVFFLMPFYMEQVLALPTATMGLMIMVAPSFMAAISPVSGALSDRIGALRMMPVAFAFLLAAFLSLTGLKADSSLWHIGLSFVLMGSGLGLLNSPNNSEIMTAAGQKYSGYASGFVATTRNLAFCFGAATAAGVFTLLLQYFSARQEYVMAYLNALHCITLAAAFTALLGLGISLWLKRTQGGLNPEIGTSGQKLRG